MNSDIKIAEMYHPSNYFSWWSVQMDHSLYADQLIRRFHGTSLFWLELASIVLEFNEYRIALPLIVEIGSITSHDGKLMRI